MRNVCELKRNLRTGFPLRQITVYYLPEMELDMMTTIQIRPRAHIESTSLQISLTACRAPENFDDPVYNVNGIFLEGFYYG